MASKHRSQSTRRAARTVGAGVLAGGLLLSAPAGIASADLGKVVGGTVGTVTNTVTGTVVNGQNLLTGTVVNGQNLLTGTAVNVFGLLGILARGGH